MIAFHLTFLCWLFNHGEPLWTVREKGVGFTCPDCQAFRASKALKV